MSRRRGITSSEIDQEVVNHHYLPPKKKKTKVLKDISTKKNAIKRSKSRVLKIQQRKLQIQQRNEIIENLKKYSLPQDQLKNLQSSSTLGKPLTRKERAAMNMDQKLREIINPGDAAKIEKKILKCEMQSKIHYDTPQIAINFSKPVDSIVVPFTNSFFVPDRIEPFQNEVENIEFKNLKSEEIEPEAHVSSEVTDADYKPAKYVLLNRNDTIQQCRLKLPILGLEQSIMEAVRYNDIVIISGETGSGKTTQLPQFLYEAGYCKSDKDDAMPLLIGITEPRRVAAVSMSKRVAHEMNLPEKIVSYHIRYESNATTETAIKFMTDGVLLKEMETDFLLKKYSVIIIDEAHERSVFSDVLIGFLTRVIRIRNKRNLPQLKLIIMSATLAVDELVMNTRVFPSTPPVIHIPTRQHLVVIKFLKRTPDDYVEAAYKLAIKIHANHHIHGGILIFVSSRMEVLELVNKLRKKFSVSKENIKKNKKHRSFPLDLQQQEIDDELMMELRFEETFRIISKNRWILDEYERMDDEDDDLEFENQSSEESEEKQFDDKIFKSKPMHILPLFGLMSQNDQRKVFWPPPENHRLCIVSTNVAETSLTIPNIKYVIDTGKCKVRVFDSVTGASKFTVGWCSKASAAQRAGRAGRTESGEVYRLYSSALYENDFLNHTPPDIVTQPIDNLVLQMKCIGIYNLNTFPFLTPPSKESISSAERILTDIGALKPHTTKLGSRCLIATNLGKILVKIPLAPRFSKILHESVDRQCFLHTLFILSCYSVREIKGTPEGGDDIHCSDSNKYRFTRRNIINPGPELTLGDFMSTMKCVAACEYSNENSFFQRYGVRYSAMKEAAKLRSQIINALCLMFPKNFNVDQLQKPLKPPTVSEIDHIRQSIMIGLFDHIARKKKITDDSKSSNNSSKFVEYECTQTNESVFIHPTSVLFESSPEWLVYLELCKSKRLYMKEVMQIDPSWLPELLPHLCSTSKISYDICPPVYDESTGTIKSKRRSSFGPLNWSLPSVSLDIKDDPLNVARWFSRYFLEGKVIRKLEPFLTKLISSPTVITKAWFDLCKRSVSIVDALISARNGNGVLSRSELIEIWKSNPNFLLSEYLSWFDLNDHKTKTAIKNLWPPISP